MDEEKKTPPEGGKKDFRRTRSANGALSIRIMAILLVLYMLAQIVQSYAAGGEDAPSLGLLILAIVVLGGGCAGLGFLTYRVWKKEREAATLTQEEQARIQALREADSEADSEQESD